MTGTPGSDGSQEGASGTPAPLPSRGAAARRPLIKVLEARGRAESLEVRRGVLTGLEGVAGLLREDPDRTVEARLRVLTPLGLSLAGNALRALGATTHAGAAYSAAVRRFEREDVELARPEERISYARALHETGSASRALEVLEELVREDNPPAAVLLLAQWLSEAGRMQAVEEILSRAAEAHPDHREVLRAFADVAVARGSSSAATALERLSALGPPKVGHDEILGRYEAARAAMPEDTELVRGYALALLRAGRGADALSELDVGLAHAKDRTLLLLARSGALLAENRPDEALEELARLAGDDRAHAQVLGLSGLAFAATGRHEEAVRSIRQALDMDPSQSHLYTALGEAELELQRYSDVLATTQQGLSIEAADHRLLLLRARALLQQDRVPEAVEALHAVLALDRDSAVAHGLLAEAYERLDQPEKALEAADRALALQPQLASALLLSSRMLAREGRFEEALERLLRIEHEPAPAWLVLERGRLHWRLDRHDEAAPLLDRALEPQASRTLSPQQLRTAHEARAHVRASVADLSGAEEDLRSALQLAPGDAALLAQLGEIQRRQGRLQDAWASLVEASQAQKPPPSVWASLGAVLAALGERSAATEALERALHVDADDASSRVLLAELLLEEPDTDERALELLRPATRVPATRLRAFQGMGRALHRLGRHGEACDMFDRVLALDARDAETHRLFALTLLHLERVDEALRHLDTAVALAPERAANWSSLAYGRMFRQEYDAAAEAVSAAVALSPTDPAVRRLHASVLIAVGELKQAADVLVPLVESTDEPDADLVGLLGWALENSGDVERLPAARDAYVMALELSDGRSPEHHRGLGNVLRAMRQPGADEHFRAALEAVHDGSPLDADTLALSAWCHYGLGSYDQAISEYLEALRLSPDDVAFTFDLALAVLCKGNAGLATQEYLRGVQQCRLLPAGQQRGLLRIALVDLDQAEIAVPLSADSVQACRDALRQALSGLAPSSLERVSE